VTMQEPEPEPEAWWDGLVCKQEPAQELSKERVMEPFQELVLEPFQELVLEQAGQESQRSLSGLEPASVEEGS
jgi:hypothetical protein